VRRTPTALALIIYMAAAAAVLAAAPGTARAEPDPDELVAQARQSMVQLDFDRAIRLLEKAESAGRSRRDTLILIYRSLAESRAALGQSDAAEGEFRRLLALDPEAQLPPGSSPKLTAPFRSARDAMRLRPPLDVTCQPGEGVAVLTITSDPLDLIAAARLVRTGDGGGSVARARRKSGRARIAIAVPPDAEPRELACAALDRHGNELARASLVATTPERAPARAIADDGDPTDVLPPTEAARRRRAASAPEAPAPAAAAPDDTAIERREEAPAPPFYARWWLWGGAALAAAGTSAYFAVQLQADEDEWRDLKRTSQAHTYDEALEVQRRGERHARYSNIATGAGAALAAISIGLLVHDLVRSEPGDDADDRRDADASVAPVVLPGGGAGAAVLLSF